MSDPNSGGTARRTGTGRVRRAVVLGGGMAGMLAAAALADRADEVVVVDRDRMPAGAGSRKGLPQARHAHLLMAGGARAVETLLPGTTDRWTAAGARRIAVPTGLVVLGPHGWFPRRPETHFMMACTRDLLDLVVREQVLARPGITLREGTEAVGLTGGAGRVTGVRVRDTGTDAAAGTIGAGLVVDACGRGSRAARLLVELGLPAVREETVDAGLVYATRIFRAPAGSEDFPLVTVQADARARVPGRGATLVPIEGGRWLVTASGTRGGEPSREAEAFEPFLRTLRHPLIADLIAGAEPLTDVYLTRSTVNRRRYFERLPAWPEGFVVLGDALAQFNPVYGQGMSVAAQSAVALRDLLGERDPAAPGLARSVQRSVARVAGGAWDLATGEDINYPGAIGPRPPVAARLLRGYFMRLMRTSTVNPRVLRHLMAVMTLSAPMTDLVRPEVVLGVLRGPGRAARTGPTITPDELALCGPDTS
ncbi:FAD-dependent monooxygenase [Streptomyces syringium]|uniref:2-polyprenyl-6-methoxyphenol hydroxylase-like FAD-dependent oxidoreductase n=1 Tax=Streptomyces syringium TaxID=76729 RepID=A0ABS4XZA6_9ACTN|nr:FAD-dependent monooxygenase [Streptomyces syringium]MBP2401715.1 2-polyprenyl-6-methoxyphenol hydroxylase-like FAD-dependent oxidoreductase [Streptomyces syringium]